MKVKVYRYVLLDSEGNEVMGAELYEPNPRADGEFWDRFMQGDCVMMFQYKYYEEIENE